MKALEFNGKASEYFKIWIVNILLTIITLGLYYPWAKVKNNRYFYANSLLDGKNFEYHAKGKQLFIGYLIAMVLLITYIILQKVSPTASIIMIVLLSLAIPWIILKSMLFNMRVTSFSNVHFAFKGKLGQAYINFLAYPLALYVALIGMFVLMSFIDSVILSIVVFIALLALLIYGLAFIKKNNSRFFINNLQYGQGIFKTSLEIKKFAIILLKTSAIAVFSTLFTFVVIGVIAYLTIGMQTLASFSQIGQNPDILNSSLSIIVPLVSLIYIAMIIVMIFVMAYSLAANRAYIYENTNLDENINFSSTLEALPFAWILISNFIVVIFTLGFAIPWSKVRVARVMLENTQVNTNAGFDEYISKKQSQTSSMGEQIGDAFDVDVGIGL